MPSSIVVSVVPLAASVAMGVADGAMLMGGIEKGGPSPPPFASSYGCGGGAMKGHRQGGAGDTHHKGKAEKRKKTQGSDGTLGAKASRPPNSPVLRKEESFLEPQHSIRLVKKHKAVKVQVALHRVPPKHIVFEPTRTHVVLHTMAHTKKYYLKKKYPLDVEVEAGADIEATLEYGVLTCHLPVAHDPNGALEAFKTAAGSKRTRDADSDEEQNVSPVKSKKRRVLVEKEEDANLLAHSDGIASDDESSDEDAHAAVYPGDSDDEGSEEYEDENPGALEDETAVDANEKKEKREKKKKGGKKEKGEKKKKTFLTTSHALDMIEEINVKEDSARNKKLLIDEEKRQRVEKQEDVRDQRQAEKAKKKELERQKVLAEMQRAAAEKKKKKKKLKAAALATASASDLAVAVAGTNAGDLADSSVSGEVADGPQGILKKPFSPHKPKRRVSFSNSVKVKKIPIVRRDPDSEDEVEPSALMMLMAQLAQQGGRKRRRKPVKNYFVDDSDDDDEDFVFDPTGHMQEEYLARMLEERKRASHAKKKKKNKQKHKKKTQGRALPFK